ncbi:MAG: hypothetical protein Q8N81_03205 [bacterium]|nr:hypothetical protein [bacterium]
MTFRWSVIGHQKQKQYLENALMSFRLANAYFFSGPSFIGKTSLAIDFARILSCLDDKTRPCEKCPSCRIKVESNPDFLILDGNLEIKISEIRDLQKKLSLKPFSNSSRVAIIANAENLNSESSSALLKILEEPAHATHFVFTGFHPSTVPATIISRTQRIFFSHNTPEDLLEFFQRLKVPQTDQQQLTRFSLKRIGLVKRSLEDENFSSELKDYWQQYHAILEESLFDRLQRTAALADLETPALSALLTHWLLIQDQLLAEATEESDLQRLFRAFRALFSAANDVTFNLNKKLLLDNLMIQI